MKKLLTTAAAALTVAVAAPIATAGGYERGSERGVRPNPLMQDGITSRVKRGTLPKALAWDSLRPNPLMQGRPAEL